MCVGAESVLFAPCLSPPVSTWQAQACFYAKGQETRTREPRTGIHLRGGEAPACV